MFNLSIISRDLIFYLTKKNCGFWGKDDNFWFKKHSKSVKFWLFSKGKKCPDIAYGVLYWYFGVLFNNIQNVSGKLDLKVNIVL